MCTFKKSSRHTPCAYDYKRRAGVPVLHFQKVNAMCRQLAIVVAVLLCGTAQGEESALSQHWLWSEAHAIPYETTSEQSGYFSIIEGKNKRIYIGTAKYRENAFLVEFDPKSKKMSVVVDAHQEIGIKATGFAAQAKIHTRNNIGQSGRIYFGTKQGYPKEGEARDDYLGGYPMWFDPQTKKTRVYDIPIKHQGIISVTPDESRGIAYVSTCSDERPIESTHFMVLDLETGAYEDLLDCRHMYGFIVIDHKGRAYHPILGGRIARYDPATKTLTRLTQTIDGKPPTDESKLADPKSHPINWEVSPDRKTLYSVAMSGNQLYSYDLTEDGDKIGGRSLGKLVATAESTDCRALCVAPDGTVWAGVAAKFPKRGQFLHVVSYRPGDKEPIDHGPIAIGNPDYTELTDDAGKALPYHHGVYRLADDTLLPRYVVMGICAASDGTIYVTTLCPFTVHAIRIPKVAGVTTTYYHNAHSDVIIGRLLQTDTLDDRGKQPSLKLASLFTDQVPANDTSRELSKTHGFPIFDRVGQTLTLDSEQLQVDGVLLIAEHGVYNESDTGQFVFPKRRLFSQVVDEFERMGEVVPVFCDKHLADNWKDAKWIYDESKRLQIPMMAGSSLPVLWRDPPTDVKRGTKLKQIVITSYHRLDTYGFHALEAVQALAERREGGETGVARVRYFGGEDVWKADTQKLYDRKLLDKALARLKLQTVPNGKRIEDLAAKPELLMIDYKDGLRACVFSLNYAVAEWAAAWSDHDGKIDSTRFAVQEKRPFGHFTYLLTGVERMMHTGQPTWPVERTLLTSGILDAVLTSKREGGRVIETPWLQFDYQTQWNWQQPPPPPPGRPITER
jgi:sugar lactone lactonase YvrE